MKNKILVCIVLLGIVILAGTISCNQENIQAQYDILAAQYAEANEQLGELQEKLFEAQTLKMQYDDLMIQYGELTDQNDTNLDEIADLKARNEELQNELQNEIDELTDEIEVKINELATLAFDYDELKTQYDVLIGSAMAITEENIEQALFDLINQERISYGLNELELGHNLVNWALANSQDMAVSKELEQYTANYVPFQRVHITTGYSSLDRVVNATLLIWQSHALFYEDNVLAEDALYSAVGVVKSGDICYITFMASNFP